MFIFGVCFLLYFAKLSAGKDIITIFVTTRVLSWDTLTNLTARRGCRAHSVSSSNKLG